MKLEELATTLQELPARIERVSVNLDKATDAALTLAGTATRSLAFAEALPSQESLDKAPTGVDSIAARDVAAAYFLGCLMKEALAAGKTGTAAGRALAETAYRMADGLLAAR